jgi:hypothetical protein
MREGDERWRRPMLANSRQRHGDGMLSTVAASGVRLAAFTQAIAAWSK